MTLISSLLKMVPIKGWVMLVVITTVAGIVMGGFNYVSDLQTDLVETNKEIARQDALIEKKDDEIKQWDLAVTSWMNAYHDQITQYKELQQKMAVRDKVYVAARAKTYHQLEELANAPDPNSVRSVDLGNEYWLPLINRAKTYNAASGLPETRAGESATDADTGADRLQNAR